MLDKPSSGENLKHKNDMLADNDNEEELTEERLIIWAELIKDEFGI